MSKHNQTSLQLLAIFILFLYFLQPAFAHKKNKTSDGSKTSSSGGGGGGGGGGVSAGGSGNVKVSVSLKGSFSQVIAFGDSYTDTGNCMFMNGLRRFFGGIIANSPYGSIFKSPKNGNRFCDGRLVVDFLCEELGLPHLPPYKDPKVNVTNGVNFAVSGSTSLTSELFSKYKIGQGFLWKSMVSQNFLTQLDWFDEFIQKMAASGAAGATGSQRGSGQIGGGGSGGFGGGGSSGAGGGSGGSGGGGGGFGGGGSSGAGGGSGGYGGGGGGFGGFGGGAGGFGGGIIGGGSGSGQIGGTGQAGGGASGSGQIGGSGGGQAGGGASSSGAIGGSGGGQAGGGASGSGAVGGSGGGQAGGGASGSGAVGGSGGGQAGGASSGSGAIGGSGGGQAGGGASGSGAVGGSGGGQAGGGASGSGAVGGSGGGQAGGASSGSGAIGGSGGGQAGGGASGSGAVGGSGGGQAGGGASGSGAVGGSGGGQAGGGASGSGQIGGSGGGQAGGSAQATIDFTKILVWIGEMGVNDYSRIIRSSALTGNWFSQTSVDHVAKILQGVLDKGAKYLVVQGLPPVGCLPLALSHVPDSDRDEHGCSATINNLVKVHNQLLQKTIAELQGKHKDCVISYADYFGAYISIMTNVTVYQVEEPIKACCGASTGSFNFNPKQVCGAGSTGKCSDPSKYIVWDGLHLTEAMHKHLADLFFNKGFCSPSIPEMIAKKNKCA